MSRKQFVHLCLAMAVVLAGLAAPLVQPAVALGAAPSVTTDNATGVDTNSATLNGDLTSMGGQDNVTVSFVWRTVTGEYTGTTDNQTLYANGAFSAALTGLTPGTTYYFKAKAVGDGTSYGEEKSFTTLTAQPSVTTFAATLVTITSATLNGYLDATGTASNVTVSFAWGTTDGGPYTNPVPVSPAMIAPGAFSAPLSGLAPKTTYYYIARAVGDGSVDGAQMSFTTSTTPPTVTTDSATSIATTSASLNGNLTAKGTADNVTVSLQWGTTSGEPYTNETEGQVMTTIGAFSAALTGLTPATTYYFRAMAVGDGTSYGEERTFSTLNQAPATPTNVSPNAETVAVTPTLTGSPFSDPGDTHAAAQWQIRSVTGAGSSYNSPVFDSGTDNVNLTTIIITLSANLKYSTIYFWHVRYRDNNEAWSEYSAETWFLTSANQVPSQPVNSAPPDGTPDQSLTPTLGSSAFVDPDAGDTHLASQWQIAVSTSHGVNPDGSYASAVFDSDTDSVNLTSLMVPSSRLSYSTVYYWHVRHQDNGGAWSAWSVETSFTTKPNQPPGPPTNSLPANLAAGVSLTPTLQSSAFNDPGDTHAASQWQITTVAGNFTTGLVYDNVTFAPNLTSTVVPSGLLSYSTTYYWRVRHQDGQPVWSEWSSLTSFTTAFTDTTPPTTPVVTDDGASTTSLTELHATWTSNDAESGIDEYQYAIGTTAGGTGVVNWTPVGTDTEVTQTGLMLTWGAVYYFSVKAKNGQGAWSSIGSSNGIQVADATPPTTPVVTDDGGATTSTSQLHATWTSDDPESGIDRYQYAIGTTAGGTDVVGWTSVGTSVAVTRTGITLTVGITYYFGVRARNEDGVWSNVGVSDGILVLPEGKGQGDISEAGGTVQTADGKITVRFPADVVVGTVTVTIEQIAEPSGSNPLEGFEAGTVWFVIEVTDAGGKAVVTFSESVGITVRYSEADMVAAGGNPNNLVLACWDEAAGEWKVLETRVNTHVMMLSASTSHLSTWALLAKTTSASDGLPAWVLLLCLLGATAAVVTAVLIFARKWFSLKD